MTKQTPGEQLAEMYDEYVELCAKAEQPVKNYHEWDEFGGWIAHRYELKQKADEPWEVVKSEAGYEGIGG